MDRLWWQLQGPRRFAEAVARDLREGNSVVVCLPAHALPHGDPDELERAVRAALGAETEEVWDTIDLGRTSPANPPEHTLCARFAPNLAATDLRTIDALTTAVTFAGRIIWVRGMTPERWPRWRGFLSAYRQQAQAHDLYERTVLCVPLDGFASATLPPADTGLTHRYWQGIVDRFDMALYTAQLVRDHPGAQLERHVSISMIVSLAQWDPNLVTTLATIPLRTLLEPTQLLADIARDRGWDAYTRTSLVALSDAAIETTTDDWYRGHHDEKPLPDLWASGGYDLFDGQPQPHSALLAISDQSSEVERRIWVGQVRELFPFVEDTRQRLIESLGNVLTVPFEAYYGAQVVEITERRDLEIGHIHTQVRRNIAIHGETRRLVAHLKAVRDALSHIRVVGPEMLLVDELDDRFIARALYKAYS